MSHLYLISEMRNTLYYLSHVYLFQLPA
uniref:Uncharacterized protein n=1 Tax=Anguilla anguilla TaxID=7936 RepID=A0A0E9UVX0_ANGAN